MRIRYKQKIYHTFGCLIHLLYKDKPFNMNAFFNKYYYELYIS